MTRSIAIGELLDQQRVVTDSGITSKKRLMELLSELIADAAPDLGGNEVLNSLLRRERLGSTGLGRGVALPHGRLAEIDHAMGAFVKLEKPIDYDAMDAMPVDLVFALVVPEKATEGHLEILASLAEKLGSQTTCEQLRTAATSAEVFDILCHEAPDS